MTLSASARDGLFEMATRHIQLGWHSGSQLAVFGHDDLLVDLRLGAASATQQRLLWFSASKPLTAVAILMLVERGMLNLDEPLGTYWPAFGANGKERVTCRHVLLHQGGFPVFPRDFDWDHIDDWPLVSAATAGIQAEWVPGTDIGYHPLTFGFALGEVIRLVDGRMPREFLHDELFLPLSMDASLGVHSASEQEAIVLPEAKSEATWQDPEGAERRTSQIVDRFRRPSTLRAQLPAANVIGTAEALARFYAMLLCGGRFGGHTILGANTIREATRVHAATVTDRVSGMPSSFGLGFLVGGPFEPYCREGVYGHSGQQCAIAYADPSTGLAVAYVTNGLQDPLTVQLRWEELVATVDQLQIP